LAVGGVVYSVNGFQAAADFAGEARDPERTVPRAIIAGIALAVLVYLALQLAFLFAVPDSMLGGGWKGVNFDSPFGQLALTLNLQWLSLLLYADAVILRVVPATSASRSTPGTPTRWPATGCCRGPSLRSSRARAFPARRCC